MFVLGVQDICFKGVCDIRLKVIDNCSWDVGYLS
jgi:hypothetical protein